MLVYPPIWDNKPCSIAVYDDDKYSKRPNPFWRRDDDMGRAALSRAHPPTHYMPLPDPPAP